jgi:hypothetical protein
MVRRISYAQKRDEFLALCRQGLPSDLIAARLGWTLKQTWGFWSHLKQHGRCPHPMAPATSTRSALEGREAEIAALRRQGLSFGQIARRYGVSRNLVAGFIWRRKAEWFAEMQISLPALPPVPDGAIEAADVKAGAWMQKMLEDA